MLKQYLTPWYGLTYLEIWSTFFSLMMDRPPEFVVDPTLIFSAMTFNQVNEGYTTNLLNKIKEMDPLFIGNKCADIEELSFFPLSLNVTISRENEAPVNVV